MSSSSLCARGMSLAYYLTAEENEALHPIVLKLIETSIHWPRKNMLTIQKRYSDFTIWIYFSNMQVRMAAIDILICQVFLDVT